MSRGLEDGLVWEALQDWHQDCSMGCGEASGVSFRGVADAEGRESPRLMLCGCSDPTLNWFHLEWVMEKASPSSSSPSVLIPLDHNQRKEGHSVDGNVSLGRCLNRKCCGSDSLETDFYQFSFIMKQDVQTAQSIFTKNIQFPNFTFKKRAIMALPACISEKKIPSCANWDGRKQKIIFL